MLLKAKLRECHNNGSALLACNYYNFETLKSVCIAARNKEVPIILQLTRSSIDYMGLQNAVSMGRQALNSFGVTGWIHLDHADSTELVYQCLDAGFDSVMIDASEKPFEKNIKITREVVKRAKIYNANVEAELGYVAKLGQSTDKIGFTEPEEARKFVEQTGVDALAVAIGSAHGFYKKEPKLDLPRLAEINSIAGCPLVLHGGSGIPGETIQMAISNGICKINVATEIKNKFMKSLTKILQKNEEIDLRKVFPAAIKQVTTLVESKINIIYEP